MTKFCPRCKEILPVEEFNWKIKNKKRASYCKKCSRYYINEHYKKNKDYYKEKAIIRNKAVRLEINQFLFSYLQDHPCIDCGEDNPVVLEFDHKDRGKKFMAIGTMKKRQYSISAIKKEISRCDIRCANCHRIKTSKQFNWYKASMAN